MTHPLFDLWNRRGDAHMWDNKAPKIKKLIETVEKELLDYGESDIQGPLGISTSPTPYAVRCLNHGKVYLTEAEYNKQMWAANDLWHCPVCPQWEDAQWDEENFEEWTEKDSDLEDEQGLDDQNP